MTGWIDLLKDAPDASSIGNAFMQGQAQSVALRQARIEEARKAQAFADQRAYQGRVNALASAGDYTGAAAAAAAFGDDKAATNFTTLQKNGYDQRKDSAGAMGEVVRGLAGLPYDQRHAALVGSKAYLVRAGINEADIDAFDPTDTNLAAISGLGYSAHDRAADTTNAYDASTKRYDAETKRIDANNPVVVGGSLVTRAGQELYRSPEYINAPFGNKIVEVGGATAQGYAGGPVTADQLYHSAIKPQESGGMAHGGAGAVGPPTPYGRALGSSQMLPGTAAAMAKKLGLEWRPELMRANTPEGLAYQDRLGVAYAQQALDATGGDPRQAAMYYFGGPDRNLWKNRTKRYGDEVVGRLERSIGSQQTTRQTRVIDPGSDVAGARAAAKSGQVNQAVQQAIDSFDRAIRTGNQLLQHKGFGAAVGSGADPQSYGSWNPISGKPFAGTNAADFLANMEAMKSQVFLPMVQSLRGMGALSNAEGDKLTAAIGALDNSMSEAGFKSSLQQIIRDLTAYRDRARIQLGQGGPAASAVGSIAAPPAAIEHLRANPALRDAFDSKYGAGSAASVLGQ